MGHPKPLGELLYCTLQNLYYHSIQQQHWLLENGQTPRIHENCTIQLNGPRQSGWSYALKQFLLNDCENAIVICPTMDQAKQIWRYENKGDELIRERGHVFSSVGCVGSIRGHNADVVIYSDYSLMEKTKTKELELMEQCLRPVIYCPAAPDEHKVLIRLH